MGYGCCLTHPPFMCIVVESPEGEGQKGERVKTPETSAGEGSGEAAQEVWLSFSKLASFRLAAQV